MFNKEKFEKEANFLFDGFGKDDISYDDLDYSDPSYWSEKYCSVVRETLELRPSNGSLNRHVVLNNIDKNWELNYFFRIYNYLAKNNNATLTDIQRNTLINWCNLHITSVSFKTAIIQEDHYHWSLDEKATMLSFFMRMLNLLDYPQQVYIDMLSFLKHNDSQENIIPFVEKVPGVNSSIIKMTILNNLEKGIENSMLFRNYLDYVKEKNISEAAHLLIPYLQKDTISEKLSILKLYKELGGALNALEDSLKNMDDQDDFKTYLVDAFVSEGGSFIREYLALRFKKEKIAIQKLKWAGFLTRLSIPMGIKYYLGALKENGVVPSNSPEENPLFFIQETRYVNGPLDIIKYAKEVPRNHFPGQNVRSVALRALQNIGLRDGQYKTVNRKINRWIFKEKFASKLFRKKGNEQNAIQAIRFFWESVTKQYYINIGKNLKLDEALNLYNEFKIS